MFILKNPIASTPFKSYIFPKPIITNNDTVDAVGIDLGTTRCCAAVNRRTGIETVALDNEGQRLLPSFVGFDEKNVKCGQIVIDRLQHHEKTTVYDSKRLLGRKYDEIKLDKNWPFEVLNENEKVFVQLVKGSTVLSKIPEEISAELLKQIKEKVKEFQGKELSDAVITIPVAFNILQMKATFDAAILAGWKKVYFLPEPVAAAFAYFIDHPFLNNSNLLLFDLGGGTLDVCIFKIQNNQLKIISRSGNLNLGGRDFDNLLINFFKEELKKFYGIEVSGNKRHKLMLECHKIKVDLSYIEEYQLDANEYNCDLEGYIVINRHQFQSMAYGLLEDIKKVINILLMQSGYDEVDQVLQVGGACRMPMIDILLKEMFPMAQHISVKHVDEIVAVGAGYYAYQIGLPLELNQPLFGAHPRTHIANASIYLILTKVDTTKNPEINFDTVAYSLIDLSKEEDSFVEAIFVGFKVIKPRNFMEFKPPVGLFDGSWIKRATVYISIYSIQSKNIVKICENYTVKDNDSIIITPENIVCLTKNGTLWIGVNGVNYEK